MQMLHSSSAKSICIHDAVIRMQLVHLLYYQICSADSSYPLVVMVEPTYYRYSNYLVPCLMRGERWSVRFRKLLPNPLMRSGPVEVRHILIEQALELLLVKDQQVVETFLSYTPGRSVHRRHWLVARDTVF
jgi:hypothetical protein